jgi:type II secretory pathway component PulF
LQGGGDWIDALARARVVRPAEAALLKTAEKTRNLPWALRQIATRRDRSAIYRLSALVQVGYPMLILLLGALVGFFVVSMFIPIVHLIDAMSK